MRNLKIIGIALLTLIPSLGIYIVTREYIPAIAMATAIATATMAIINFLYLKELRASRMEALNREIKEVIYSKLHRQLETFLVFKSFQLEDLQSVTLPINWEWEMIKRAQFHLAYKIPKRIFDKLNQFTEIFNECKKYFEQLVREIKRTISFELQKTNLTIDTDSYLRVRLYFRTKASAFPFNIFDCLFLSKDIKESIKLVKLEKAIDSDLICEFQDGGWQTIYSTKNEQETIQFFEPLFKNIKQNSINFKEFMRLKEEGNELAEQILKQISPE